MRRRSWSRALAAASSLATPSEWRRALASTTREASGAMVVAVITCPPGFWLRIQRDTVPERYGAIIDRISAEFVPRIEQVGEDWRFALRHHPIVYAPLDSAISRSLAEEIYQKVLAPEGIRGWLTAWFLTREKRLVGFLVVGTAEPSSRSLPRLKKPLSEVARRAAKTLETTLELAQGCGGVVPELDDTAPSLTRRERQIADLVTQGFSNANIAARLELSVNTVGVHVRHIYRKLGVHSRVELNDALRRRNS